jgi:hypothetical protein
MEVEFWNSTRNKLLAGGRFSTTKWTFQDILGRAKSNLVKFKTKHSLPVALICLDIIPLVNEAWDKSFGNTKTNKKVIAKQGWNPLNMNLLLLKQIQAIGNTKNNLDRLPLVLNSANSMSAAVFSRIVQCKLRHNGRQKNQQNLEEEETIAETL